MLAPLHGELELTAQGQWQWQPQTKQIRINGSAVPRARAGELESLLNMIGTEQGDGRHALSINTRPPPIFVH